MNKLKQFINLASHADIMSSQVALVVKNPLASAGDTRDIGSIPGWRAWQPTPVFLPGEFTRTEEPGGLQSTGSQRVRHN